MHHRVIIIIMLFVMLMMMVSGRYSWVARYCWLAPNGSCCRPYHAYCWHIMPVLLKIEFFNFQNKKILTLTSAELNWAPIVVQMVTKTRKGRIHLKHSFMKRLLLLLDQATLGPGGAFLQKSTNAPPAKALVALTLVASTQEFLY